MENKHKHYLKFFETIDEYNNQKYLDINDPNYIMGDPHVVMIGNDGDVKNIIFFDSTRFSRNYFTIEALEDTTIKFSNNTLEYRIIGKTNRWNMLSSNTYINLESNQKIQFKMTNPRILSSSGIGTFTISKSCNIEGNIMSLLYGDDFVGKTDLTYKNHAFYKLFKDCKTIKNAKNLVLPSERLAGYCYSEMFSGCTSLVTAPELQSKILASGCYEYMFAGCTSLVNAPALPAETLANYCYRYMFSGCTSLTTAPELPSTTLAESCYEYMFAGCTSLVNAPELPATKLASDCYGNMFYNCTSLVNAPSLPATTLAESCYKYMFYNCTSLVTAPSLPATKLASKCYQYMFSGCTSLVTAPELKNVTILADCCCRFMFRGCASLVTAPELPSTTLTESCYESMFGGCTSLVNAPALPAETLASYCYSNMFQGCTSLVNAPALPAKILSKLCYTSMFSGCASLVTAPSLPATTLEIMCYDSMFNGCSSLVTAPALPVTTLVRGCYSSMFSGCTSLVTAPELPYRTLSETCYAYMFSGCTSLVNAPTLPATTLAEGCYAYMFKGCTSLTTAPELPATTLANYCYRYMFSGCINLNYIKMLATDISASNCLSEWVYGVSNEGIFHKNISLTSIQRGENGIPNGWSVYVNCVSPSFINTLNSNVNFYNKKDIYAPKSDNLDLTNRYSNDELLSMQPECDLYVDIVYRYKDNNTGEIIKEKHLWENTKNLNDILSELNYNNSISKIVVVIVDKIEPEESGYYYDDNLFEYEYFTIEALEDGLNVILTHDTYYRIDNGDWILLYGGLTTPSIYTGQKIQFKMTNPTISTSSGIGKFTISKSCNIEGNIMSLLYGDDFVGQTDLTGKNYVFSHLFYNCSTIKNAINLVLPATTLAESCYEYMFYNCASLVTAPKELPSTTLASDCYKYMFYSCTSLVNTPSLPAKTLASDCYYCMFSGCRSLVTAPTLQATTLAEYCYNNMFSGCTSLVTAPALPSTTLAEYCYRFMFSGCTSLVNAPALPATTLAIDCYANMFQGCTSLVAAPTLPSTTLEPYCYYYMFQGCSKLSRIEMLATDISASYCLINWVSDVSNTGLFIKNINLTSIQRGENGIPNSWSLYVNYCESPSFINTLNSNVNFYNTKDIYAPKSDNINLTNIYSNDELLSMQPECDLYVDIIYNFGITKEKYLWENTKNLNDILSELNLNYNNSISNIVIIIVGMIEPEESGYYYDDKLFEYEYFTIEALEDYLNVSLTQNTSYYRIDNGDWISLSAGSTTPSINTGQKIQFKMTNPTISTSYGIGKFTISKSCNIEGNIMSLLYGDDFVGQTDLTGKEYVFYDLFSNCSTIKNAINLVLPATTLAESCYGSMFYSCSSLVTSPALPATTLANNCYIFMFSGCTSLVNAPALPSEKLEDYCYYSMFCGCTSLETAPELPAEKLVSNCYNSMFYGCRKLNYIKMLAADISASSCLTNWVYNVASTGRFYKNMNSSLQYGESGMPNGWSVNIC